MRGHMFWLSNLHKNTRANRLVAGIASTISNTDFLKGAAHQLRSSEVVFYHFTHGLFHCASVHGAQLWLRTLFKSCHNTECHFHSFPLNHICPKLLLMHNDFTLCWKITYCACFRKTHLSVAWIKSICIMHKLQITLSLSVCQVFFKHLISKVSTQKFTSRMNKAVWWLD